MRSDDARRPWVKGIMTLTVNLRDAPIGAEVIGVDLAGPVDALVADEIRTALCEHAVLVFRDQAMSPEAQVSLPRQLGEPEVHVLSDFTLPGMPEVFIWRDGDFVMWDNRVTMHKAISNYTDGDVRHLLRTSVKGEVPV